MSTTPTPPPPTEPGPPILPGGATLDPAQALAIVGAQRAKTRQVALVDARVIYGMWGLAWLIGYGGLWITSRSHPESTPTAWAWIVFAVLLAAAMAVSIAHSVSRTSGTLGSYRTAGTLWGSAWGIAFGGGMWSTSILAERIDQPQVSTLYILVTYLMVGCLYMAGGAWMHDGSMFAIGARMVVMTVPVTNAAAPANDLIAALAGGGGILTGMVVEQIRLGRRRAGE
jgi:hypothetical protein